MKGQTKLVSGIPAQIFEQAPQLENMLKNAASGEAVDSAHAASHLLNKIDRHGDEMLVCYREIFRKGSQEIVAAAGCLLVNSLDGDDVDVVLTPQVFKGRNKYRKQHEAFVTEIAAKAAVASMRWRDQLRANVLLAPKNQRQELKVLSGLKYRTLEKVETWLGLNLILEQGRNFKLLRFDPVAEFMDVPSCKAAKVIPSVLDSLDIEFERKLRIEARLSAA